MGLAGAVLVLAAAGPPAPARGPVPHLTGPPTGHTGGFGEPTCHECHSEFDLDLGGELVLEGLPDTYEPGATYTVSLILRSSEMAAAGFQAAFRFASGDARGRPAGEVHAMDGRVTVQPDSLTGDPYVQHTVPGGVPASPDETLWTFQWTAPADASAGAVALHAAANSANGDNSPLGDLIYVASTILSPAAPLRGLPRSHPRVRGR